MAVCRETLTDIDIELVHHQDGVVYYDADQHDNAHQGENTHA